MKSISKRLDILIDNEKTGHLQFKDYSLKSIECLARHFGNPHNKIKTVHIAGTNGKGSVAYMLNNILINSGYRVGLYISPHLLKINERIKINNIDIPDEKLNAYIDELFQLLEGRSDLHPTYFDALTLFALRYFSEQKVDIAFIEVGLGGRLDSTNVISPLISIITEISMDHNSILGNTIKDIALEKAGIIKPESLVVTSNRKKNILDIISNISKESSSKLNVFRRDFKTKRIRELKGKGFIFDFYFQNDLNARETDSGENPDLYIKDIELKIPCKFQITNASLAIASSHLLKGFGFNIGDNEIKMGIESVKIPGRFHIISQEPLIIFDPAHNPAALKTIISSLKTNYPEKKIVLILSFMMDKEYSTMFKLIEKCFKDGIYYYELNDPRSLKISGDKTKIRDSIDNDIYIYNNINDLSRALIRNLSEDTLIFITGSFRLFSPAKRISSIIKKHTV